MDMCFSGNILKLLEKSYLLTLSIKSELAGASELQHRTQCDGKERNLSLSTQRGRRQAPLSAYARGEMCFPEIIKSFFSVMEARHHTCVHALD